MSYIERIKNLRKMMNDDGISAMYITNAENVFYMSGFTGFGDGRLFITNYSAWIITDTRYTLQANEQCPDYKLISSYSLNIEVLNDIIENENITVIGFENENILYCDFFALKNKYKNITFKGIDSYFNNARDIKDSNEVLYISKACDIACKSLNETIPLIKPGVYEIDIATELEYKMKRNGSHDKAFDTIVASGKRSAFPHGIASFKKIENQDAVTIDFGCKYMNYCSDMTRTFFVGKPCAELEKIYNIVYKAQMAALSDFYVGITGAQLDNISREIILDEGYGKYFGHSLGHGVGIDVHEGATIGPRNNKKIQNNTVFSIEPGIYIEGLGGVRIEDLVYFDGKKLINFTDKFDKKMLVL